MGGVAPFTRARSAAGEAGAPGGLLWLLAARQLMPLVLSLVPAAVMLGGVLREEADIEVPVCVRETDHRNILVVGRARNKDIDREQSIV